ncbi:hypothetical protein B2J93_6374 [Marssonina coronariae]|uniref:DUF6987 domain-containing protein n=1 Tax=Diplocarpon coronariae TaxID=2795749 RepID=A0A218ZBR2_9HELO|nr:hypothetical protein B2J93_6374 [Marssonina coronariae]
MADIASRHSPTRQKQPRTPSNSGLARSSQKPLKRDEGQSKASIREEEDAETQATATEGGQDDDTEYDEGTEVLPAGSVGHDGSVLDKEGKTIGRVKGGASSELEGSMVDEEGDILDSKSYPFPSPSLPKPFRGWPQMLKPKHPDEGNVIGTAELTKDHSVVEKANLTAPFGVQDNGEITNASGAVVGTLAEGKPLDLVGTAISAIDSKGNLKAETGTTLGKADIQPELLNDRASDDGTQISDKADSAVELEDGEAVKRDVEDATSQKLVGSEAAGEDVKSKAQESLQAPEGIDSKDEAAQVAGGSNGANDAQVSEVGEEVHTKPAEASMVGEETPELDFKPEDKSQVGQDHLDPKSAETEVGQKTPELDAKLAEGSKASEGTPELDLDPADGSKADQEKVDDGMPELDPKPADAEVDQETKLADGSEDDLPKTDELEKTKELDPKPADAEVDQETKLADGSEDDLPKTDELEENKELDPKPADAEVDQDAKLTDGSEVDPPKIDEPEQLDELDPKPADAEVDQDSKIDADTTADPETPELPDLSILKDKKVNKLGKIVDENGNPFGQLVSGDPKKLYGKKVDAQGQIWDDSGKVIGTAELLPEDERLAEISAPFEDFPDSVLDKSGNVLFEGKIVGKLVQGDAKKLEGKKVDADGDVLDKNGNTLGKAERFQEEDVVSEEEVPEAPVDLSLLEGKKVNKAGNVVDDHGKLFGRIATGDISKLVGKKVDREGKIWSDSGKVIGTAELLSVDDRDEALGSPFEDFPGAVVEKNGNVVYEGEVVGRLVEGDAKKLAGKKIDPDGEILDKVGNILGKAERWTEEEPSPEPEPEKIDTSALAGKRVNKLGNLVDSHGSIYGRLVSGDPKKLVGKMSDKNGDIWDEGGNVVGKAELVPESERDGQKEGPFTGFDSPTVTKDGKVADSHGTIIGRLVEGEAKKLYGKKVDADGDVVDSNGNSLGKAERWEEEEKPKAHSPVAGRKVNREGNVVDENGDIIAKLTEGEVTKCSGKEIDEDGDVYNSKNQVIGHVTLLGEIPAEPEPEPEPEAVVEEEPEEPEESPEEIEARKQLENDKKLASRMSFTIQESIDKMTPLLTNIMDEIEAVERQKESERDEQKLVDKVKPMIEEGGRILTETNGTIRGMDPDGRITANAKQKGATREATPEEHRLADLTGNVTQTIEKAKKKIAGMPHAKKQLNPLWGLLAEPLGQILAAVGLLLSGVLGLVGRLLSGLGLGGLLDNLLGGLGIKGILKGLGLGMVTESLTGRK